MTLAMTGGVDAGVAVITIQPMITNGQMYVHARVSSPRGPVSVCEIISCC